MSFDPLESAAAGVTRGALGFAKEEAKLWVAKFLNKELAFIGEVETIEVVKEERRTPEWEFYSKYLKNKDYRVLVQLGLALRKFESRQELTKLRDKIKRRYGNEGLHIAEFAQNKVISTFVSLLLSSVTSAPVITSVVEELLANIERHVLFVKSSDRPEQRISELNMRLLANKPRALIIFGSATAAPVAQKITEGLERKAVDYKVFKSLDGQKVTNIFLLEGT